MHDLGALTDVAGIRVGHAQRTGRGWATGTTAVIVERGAVAGVDVRGGGPGTRETDALDPRNLVDRIHGICLTGGSAYGLAAAHGVMAHLEQRGLGVQVGPEPAHVVPVVPAAVIFDLGRGGVFANRPDHTFGSRAAARARRSVGRGAVGAGTGARAGGLQGGVGTASIRVEIPGGTAVVAALAVVNSSGALIDPATGGAYWPHPALRRPSAAERHLLAAVAAAPHARPLNTTIGVVATDVALARAEAGRLAQSAHDGLARAIRPAHGLTDGDVVFGLSVPDHELTPDEPGLLRAVSSRTTVLNRVFAAAADVFATACIDAVVSAHAVTTTPALRDVCPSAYRPA